MRDDAATGPSTPASAPKAPGRPGRRRCKELPALGTINQGRAAYDHVGHIVGGGAKHEIPEIELLPKDRGPGADRDEVGQQPGLQLARVPTKRAHAFDGGGMKQLLGLVQHPATSSAPLVELQAARLLEDVDHGVGVAAQTNRAAGIDQTAKWADAIAEVTLCRRARAY